LLPRSHPNRIGNPGIALAEQFARSAQIDRSHILNLRQGAVDDAERKEGSQGNADGNHDQEGKQKSSAKR
jgi:hypothetical protein